MWKLRRRPVEDADRKWCLETMLDWHYESSFASKSSPVHSDRISQPICLFERRRMLTHISLTGTGFCLNLHDVWSNTLPAQTPQNEVSNTILRSLKCPSMSQFPRNRPIGTSHVCGSGQLRAMSGGTLPRGQNQIAIALEFHWTAYTPPPTALNRLP